MSFLRFPGSSKRKETQLRWFAGISVTSNCRRIEAALLGVHGQDSGAPVEIRKSLSFDIPREIIESYNELLDYVFENSRDQHSHPIPKNVSLSTSLYSHVMRELASVEEEAIDELLEESRLPRQELLAVGIHDPGLRGLTPYGMFYQSLCDAPYLADQTGLNIIDAFSQQDIVSGGQGGPIFAFPAWVFLKSDRRDRILIDLGRTARMTFLPRAEDAFSHQKIGYEDLVPCGSLLDALTWEATGGEKIVDIGGRLTVQGCQEPQLLAAFRKVFARDEAPENPAVWHPLGLSPEPYLKTVSKMSLDGLSYQDALCTACGFISETIARKIRRIVGDGNGSEPELLITGAGRLHGMLMNQISSRLENPPMIGIQQLGIPMESFDAQCTAMLTLMNVGHIPSGLPHLTGSMVPRSLGRLTPGSIGAWHRLLREMADAKPVERTLRAAM